MDDSDWGYCPKCDEDYFVEGCECPICGADLLESLEEFPAAAFEA